MSNRHDNIGDVFSIIKKGQISEEELIKTIKRDLPHITGYEKVFKSLLKNEMICKTEDCFYKVNPSYRPKKKGKTKSGTRKVPTEILEKFKGFSPVQELKSKKTPINLFEFSKQFVYNILASAVSDSFIELNKRKIKSIKGLIDNYLFVRNVEKPYTFEKILEETLQSFATSSAKRRAIDLIGRRKAMKETLLNYNVQNLMRIESNGIKEKLVEKFGDSYVWGEAAKCIYSQVIILNTFSNANAYINYLKNFKCTHDGKDFIKYHASSKKKYSFNAPSFEDAINIQRNYCAVYGFGEAIASNYMKEIGFDFGKPDTHLLYVMHKIGLTKNDKNRDACQKAIKKQAKKCKCTSYALDKIIWLCCTAFFYRDHNEHYLNASHYRIREVFVDELNKAVAAGLVVL